MSPAMLIHAMEQYGMQMQDPIINKNIENQRQQNDPPKCFEIAASAGNWPDILLPRKEEL